MEREFLFLTRKELFYAAYMLGLRRLVNIIYDFPADNAAFEREMNEVRSSLRKKKLLSESIRNGTNLDFSVSACAAFCCEPETCEIVDHDGYYATIYQAADVYMLMEKRSEDDLAAAWFKDREDLDKYVNEKLSDESDEGDDNNGRA